MSVAPDRLASPASWRIELGEAGGFDCPADEDSLLRAALRAGVPWPYECSVGGCGACRFEVVSGEVDELWAGAPGLGARDRARGRRLACQSRPCSDLQVRVRLSDDADAHAARLAGAAPRRQSVVLEARRDLSGDMAEFSFRSALPARFLAGQYALVHLPGVNGPRAYSMSNLANDDGLWTFIVRRTAAGQGSRVLFDVLQPGERCDLDGPYGHAWARLASPRDAVCVAGGSGLAPMLSVARALLARPGAQRLRLYLGLRHPRDLPLAQAFEALARDERVLLTTVLSEPDGAGGPAGWTGATGWVHQQVEHDLGAQAAALDHYFAGPPGLIEALQTYLMVRAKVPFAQIHFDRFV